MGDRDKLFEWNTALHELVFETYLYKNNNLVWFGLLVMIWNCEAPGSDKFCLALKWILCRHQTINLVSKHTFIFSYSNGAANFAFHYSGGGNSLRRRVGQMYPLALHNKLLKIVASKYGDAEVKVVLNPRGVCKSVCTEPPLRANVSAALLTHSLTPCTNSHSAAFTIFKSAPDRQTDTPRLFC